MATSGTENAASIKLVVDCRKAHDSGIGTYIRGVVPRVLRMLPLASVRVLIAPGTVSQHGYLNYPDVEYVESAGRPLGLGEQWRLRRIIRPGEIFWSTSLAHPLFFRGSLVTTVHDVAQVVLDAKAAGGSLAKLAAGILLQSLRKSANLLLFSSSFTRQQFLEYVGEPHYRASVIPLGVEPWWFDVASLPGDALPARPYFICVGNIRPHKNLRTLLSAFGIVLSKVPHDLVIVGQMEGLRTKDKDFPTLLTALGDRVRFLGQVDDSTLLRWVSGAQAMVLPSLYEGFGLPALEAMAAGCPVIASSAGALPEVCGSVATFFDPRSVDALVDTLVSHVKMSDANRRNKVLKGIERAKGFSWDRTAELTAKEILENFRQVLQA